MELENLVEVDELEKVEKLEVQADPVTSNLRSENWESGRPSSAEFR